MRLSHRSPDGTNLWNDGSAAMGHRMLRTTPESLHEHLPITNFTGELVITAMLTACCIRLFLMGNERGKEIK